MGLIDTRLAASKFKLKYLSSDNISAIILEEIRKICPKAVQLISDILDKAEEVQFKLKFNLLDKGWGNTSIKGKEITISINDNHEDLKLQSIIVHELAEAHYLLLKHPRIICETESYSGENKLTEMFSHHHVNQLMIKYQLEEIEQYDLRNIAQKQNGNNVNYECQKWRIIVNLVWREITFGDYSKEIDHKYKETVKAIAEIIYSLDTISEIKRDEVKSNVNKVLKILEHNELNQKKYKFRI